MKKKVISILCVIILFQAGLTGCTPILIEYEPNPIEAFRNAISIEYPLSVMKALSGFGTNTLLGFRTSGSIAEHAAAEFLYNEMRDIGLSNVRKYGLTVDSWEFERAVLSFEDHHGISRSIIMASHQTQFVSEDEEMLLVYLGRGTAADYICLAEPDIYEDDDSDVYADIDADIDEEPEPEPEPELDTDTDADTQPDTDEQPQPDTQTQTDTDDEYVVNGNDTNEYIVGEGANTNNYQANEAATRSENRISGTVTITQNPSGVAAVTVDLAPALADENEADADEASTYDEQEEEGVRQIDVEGKIVLISIDQREDWRVNWPAYQAKLRGARAIIAINTGGYFQRDDTTLGVHNISGPKDAPAFTVSVRDGNTLRRFIEDSEDGHVSVRITASSRVTEGGRAYSVVGEIPGVTEDVLYMTANYDGYFHAFEDNASGVGTVLGIAKALIDSGYSPQKTLRFVLHPAGEWGAGNSRYDRATGAYLTISKNIEWAENAFALISIDGGVTGFYADGIEVGATPEIMNFAREIGRNAARGNPIGDFEVVPLTSRWAEGFVYAQRGIPVIVSGFSGIERQLEEINHTNRDIMEYSYFEDAVLFAQKLYGTYLIELDLLQIRPLNFLTFFDELLATVDSRASDNMGALLDAIDEAIHATRSLNNIIRRNSFDDIAAAEINAGMFRISRYIQNNFISLTWQNEIIFAHERHKHNAETVNAAMEALIAGDGETARELISTIDLNRYAIYFDREVYDFFVGQVLGNGAVNLWGRGYITTNTDLFDVIRSINEKLESDEIRPDYTSEIQALEIELLIQQRLFRDTIGQMTRNMITLTRNINNMVNLLD